MESWRGDLLSRQSRDDAAEHRRPERFLLLLEDGVHDAHNPAAKGAITSSLCMEASRSRDKRAAAVLRPALRVAFEDLARANCSQHEAQDAKSA